MALLAGALALACHGGWPGGPGGSRVTMVATEYAFGGPDTIAAGLVTIRLVNAGKEPHQAGVVRIEGPRRSRLDIAAGLESASPPPWMHFVGGPDAVNGGEATSSTQLLIPGNHVLVCFLPSPDGTMHLEKGMIRRFAVAAGDPSAVVPVLAGDDTITLADYSVDVAHPLAAGKHTILVENRGLELHEVMVLALPPGRSVHDLVGWTSQWMPGPLPFEPLGGIVALDPGARAAFTVTLARGTYVLACFIPDRTDGKSHLLHGMMREITVD